MVWNSRAFALLFVVIFVTLPLVFFRRVGKFIFHPFIFNFIIEQVKFIRQKN
jgi:hypothetical protein